MRRLISIAAFALVFALPVFAQRGGHGGGGMHGGGFAGHAGGGHSFGGMRSGAGFSRGFTHSSSGGNWHGSSWNHRSHSNGVHFRTYGIRNYCYGYSCGNWGWRNSRWGWGWGGGWYDPWVWSSWDEQDRRFDEDYYGQYAMAERWNQRSLEEQRMRQQEEADADQDSYAPRSSRHYAPETASQPSEPQPATVLVFRDQHRQDVQNYAIVGQTLWAFSAGRNQKISLASLDVAATEKANDDRGVTFRVPGTNEGQ